MIELLKKRKSVRSYSSGLIEPEKIEILKEAVLCSPSSKNLKCWEFIFVTDKSLLSQLSKSKAHGSSFLAEAPLGIVVLGDSQKSTVWIEDCSIAAIILQLSAESMGIGSCWIQIRNRNHNIDISAEKYIQELLKIPAHLKVLAILSLGYPQNNFSGISERIPEFNKIHYDLYGSWS